MIVLKRNSAKELVMSRFIEHESGVYRIDRITGISKPDDSGTCKAYIGMQIADGDGAEEDYIILFRNLPHNEALQKYNKVVDLITFGAGAVKI